MQGIAFQENMSQFVRSDKLDAAMTREEFEARLTPSVLRELVGFASKMVGDLAEDAVQEALRYFWESQCESFDPSGSAELLTYLKGTVRWRALNIKKAYGRWVPLDTLCDDEEPWVKPWDDYDHEGRYLDDDPEGDDSSNESEDISEPSAMEKVVEWGTTSEESLRRFGGWEVYWNAHPQEYEKDIQAGHEEQDRESRGYGLQSEHDDGSDDEPNATEQQKHSYAAVVRALNPEGRWRRRPPGAGFSFCDYVHVHKYGYPRFDIFSCPLCSGSDSPIGETPGTRESPAVYSPSLDPVCSQARSFIGAYMRHAQHIYGYTRPALLEAPVATCWAGDDYAMHCALSQLSAEESGLLWLFGQGYLQEEINDADNISDPYARALARPFNGIGQTNISRKYTHIKKRITDLYECASLFPAPSTAKGIALRTAQRVKAYAIPADETCRYCGGLMLQTWVDERWRRLLDHVTGVDPAYLAKRCVNCGDLIDCLTLKRRPKDYRQREEVPGFGRLGAQYALPWTSDNPGDIGLPRKDHELERLEMRRGVARLSKPSLT